jgi:hypothetical protein
MTDYESVVGGSSPSVGAENSFLSYQEVGVARNPQTASVAFNARQQRQQTRGTGRRRKAGRSKLLRNLVGGKPRKFRGII